MPSQQQRKGQGSNKAMKCTLQEAEKLQREVMRYMIFKYASSPMEPVIRAELSKSILEGYQHHKKSNLTSHVIMMAQVGRAACHAP